MTRAQDQTNYQREQLVIADEFKQIQKVCRQVREHEQTKADTRDLNRVETNMQRFYQLKEPYDKWRD